MSSLPSLLVHSLGPAQPRWPVLLRAWLPALFLMLLIAAESTAVFGADHTSRPLHKLAVWFLGSSIDPDWSLIHHFLRKTGHFLGFATLSLVCFRGFRRTSRNRRRPSHPRQSDPVPSNLAAHTLSVLAAIVIASADELHQHFLPNRTGSLHDVLLDASGALVVQILLFLALHQGASPRHVSAEEPQPSPTLSLAA